MPAALNTSQTVVKQYISGATKVAKESTNKLPAKNNNRLHIIAVIDYQMINFDRATSNRWHCNVEMMTFCPNSFSLQNICQNMTQVGRVLPGAAKNLSHAIGSSTLNHPEKPQLSF